MKYILVISVIFTISCSRDISNSPADTSGVTTKSINSLKMDCQGSTMSCSGAVGAILIFEGDRLNTFCTAFVLAESIGHSVVATSSHCLKPAHHNIIEPTNVNREYIFAKYDVTTPNSVEFFEINQVLFSTYGHTDRLGLDYAYLSTHERVNVPEHTIHHNVIDRSELPLTVTTASFDKDNLLISIKDQNNCSSLSDRSQIIKSIFVDPENFGIENCRFYPGNSGAPVFFKNNLAGILNSGLMKTSPKDLGFEEHNARQAYANNILCTEPLKIKKASRNSERPLFSQKWFCKPSFVRSDEFSFLIEKMTHKDAVLE
ncbi:MAG: hypothetical protein MK008_13155 [Bdellovibrionales bacterium]|nr:hypothetical protein [Bdellovibrionales bacterium]